MADQKISELTQLVAANIAATDELAIVDSSVPRTKKVTASDLADYVVEQGLFGPDILSTVGDGTTGTYALGWTPTSESTISVFVDGVLQDYVTDAAYAVAGSNIVLAENLPDGSLLTVFRREVASTQPAFATNVKFVQEYKTVAALQGSNEAYAVLPVGEYVRVLDGNFVYKILNSASTGDVANGAATPVQFEVVPGASGAVDVDAFAPPKTSGQDDASAIHTAIDRLTALGGGKLTFSSSDYYLSTGITVGTSRDVPLIIDLGGSTIHVEAAVDAFTLSQGQSGPEGCSVFNGVIDGGYTAGSGGVTIDDHSEARVWGTRIKGCETGLR